MIFLVNYLSKYLKNEVLNIQKNRIFYNEFLTDEAVQMSAMKYPNKLKDQDSYPEDYLDQKK